MVTRLLSSMNKFSLEQATKAQRVSRGIALPFHDLGAEVGMGGQHHAPAALPPGKTRYPLYRRLGRPQGRSGRVRKISPPPGFDPRTVQPVASRYTDCPPSMNNVNNKMSLRKHWYSQPQPHNPKIWNIFGPLELRPRGSAPQLPLMHNKSSQETYIGTYT